MRIDRDSNVLNAMRAVFESGSLAGLSDLELLERASRRGEPGAERAFACLVERHGPMVLRVCRARLPDPNDADDAFQSVFCLLARRARTLWVRDSIGPWLLQVALRVASGSRAELERRRIFERRYAEQSPRVVSSPDREPDDLRPMLLEEVARLPERDRSVVVLCDLEGLTHEEAAHRLGWPVGTVKSRQSRARDRLRRRLKLRGVNPGAVVAIAPLFAPKFAPAAVPRPLLERAVHAAVQSAAASSPSWGSVLVSGALTMMNTHRIASAAVGLLLVGVAAVGTSAIGWPGGPGVGEGLTSGVVVPAQQEAARRDIEEGDGEGDGQWLRSVLVTLTGEVTDQDREPVEGASVFLLDARRGPENVPELAVLARSETAPDGSYRFEGVEVPLKRPRIIDPIRPTRTPPIAAVQVVATRPGSGISWHEDFSFSVINDPRQAEPDGERLWMDLRFRPADAIEGTLVGEGGRPMAGVGLELDWIDRLPSDPREDTRLMLAPLRGAGPEWAGFGLARSGADGRFRIEGLPSESVGSIRVRHPEFDGSGFEFAAMTAEAVGAETERLANQLDGRAPLASGFVLKIPEFRAVPVRVVDEGSGMPIEGVRVGLAWPQNTDFFANGTSDAEGNLTLGLPAGTYSGLSATPPEDSRYLRSALKPLTMPPDPGEPIEIRLQRGFELIIDVVDAGTGEPMPGAAFWLMPVDGGEVTRRFLIYSNRPGEDGRIRELLRPEPGRKYQLRLAGFPGVMSIRTDRDSRFEPSPFVVEPSESQPFEPNIGGSSRFTFEVGPYR